MATIIPVPTLSAAGWVTSPSEKADALMSHFYESLKSQTHLYSNHVANLQYVIEQFGHDIPTLCQQLRTAAQKYLGAYYATVDVDVTSEDLITNETGRIELKLYATVLEKDGTQYSFGRLLRVSGSKLEKVVKLNELGDNTTQ